MDAQRLRQGQLPHATLGPGALGNVWSTGRLPSSGVFSPGRSESVTGLVGGAPGATARAPQLHARRRRMLSTQRSGGQVDLTTEPELGAWWLSVPTQGRCRPSGTQGMPGALHLMGRTSGGHP